MNRHRTLQIAQRYDVAATLSDFAYGHITEVKQSPMEQVKRVCKAIADEMKSNANAMSLNKNLPESDIHIYAGQADEITKIARSANYDDIRMWEGYATIGNDAVQQLEAVAAQWHSIAEKELDKIEAMSVSGKRIRFEGVPNYRYKIGTMVKLKSTGQTGRVVATFKENGFGRQMYRIALVNQNKKVLCSLGDLTRA